MNPSLFFSKRLDLDVHARRQIQLHQRVHRLRRRLENIEQPLVRPDLELLPRLLIDVRRAQNRILIRDRRQRNRSRHLRACALGRIDDFGRRLVQNPVIVRLQSNSNAFSQLLIVFSAFR